MTRKTQPKARKPAGKKPVAEAQAKAKPVPQTPDLPRKKRVVPAHVKAAADRAEARAAGLDPDALEEKNKKGEKISKKAPKKASKGPAVPTIEELAELDDVIQEARYRSKVGRGRPSKYKPEYAAVARALCARGATDYEMAEEFQVSTVTIWRWQAQHEDFRNALAVAKDAYDDRVERSLAQRAVGYTYESEKVFSHLGRITRAQVIEHVPPDIGAAKLWLTNRRPDKWRDKMATELTGKDGGAIEFIESPRDRILSRIEDIAKRKVSSAG